MRGTAIRIVFFGSDEFSLPILTALLDRGPSLAVPVNVAGVVTQPDRPGGRGRKLLTSPVKVEAAERQVPVLQPERLRRPEEIEPLAQLRPDLFVVASFGQLLRQRVLDLPTRGCLNLHPSLLPRYRGPAPIVAPILSGDAVTGTSVMQMELAMDAGPVVTQVSTPIEPEETAGELCSRLAQLSADLLL